MTLPSLISTWNKIKPWFPFKFSSRQHLWIQHIKVDAKLDEATERICIIYIGSTMVFNSLYIKLEQKYFDQGIFSSFDSFEDTIARSFFNDHFMYEYIDTNKSCKLLYDLDVKVALEMRSLLYLDYKFHKDKLKVQDNNNKEQKRKSVQNIKKKIRK